MTNIGELLVTGDLGPSRNDPHSIFALAAPRLRAADCVLGQLEPVITHHGTQMPQARLAMRTTTDAARAIRASGFHVVSLAGNHCMDWGTEGLTDTISVLHDSGVKVIGAGENLTRAVQHEIVAVGSARIALLAFNSILPMGYEATESRPGSAPLRAFTYYEQIEHDQPGTPSRTHSFANRVDLESLQTEIHRARSNADLVVLSLHWGIHFVPHVLADYQREIARGAIDAGADAVVGHHPHILKGVETYKGKVIFYSLGNFAIDPPTAFDSSLKASRRHQEIVSLNDNWIDDGQHVVLRDSALAVVARCTFGKDVGFRTSALPVQINSDSQPEFLSSSDSRFDAVCAALKKTTLAAGLNGQFASGDDEILIT